MRHALRLALAALGLASTALASRPAAPGPGPGLDEIGRGQGTRKERPAAGGLEKARALFGKLDLDADGFVSAAEAGRGKVPEKQFVAADDDRDRRLSRDEFVLFYRELLVQVGRPVPADLDGESARIEAARRMRRAEELRRASRKDAQAPEAPRGDVRPRTGPEGSVPPATPDPRVVANRSQALAASGLVRGLVDRGRLSGENARDYEVLLSDPGEKSHASLAEVQRAHLQATKRLPRLVLAGHLSAEEARQIGLALDAGLAAHSPRATSRDESGDRPRQRVADGTSEPKRRGD